MKRKLISGFVALGLAAPAAMAAMPIWSNIVWNPYMLTDSAGKRIPYVDLPQAAGAADNVKGNPSELYEDLVGDPDTADYGTVNYHPIPTAYWAIQDGNILFRMRVDAEPQRKDVWTVLLNTNPYVDRIADYAMVLDTTNLPAVDPQHVEIWEMLKGGPADDWKNITFGAAQGVPLLTQSGEWMLKSLADSYIDGDGKWQAEQDWFVSMAMPLTDFMTYTHTTYGSPIKIAFGTSTNPSDLNKDLPDYGATYTWDVIVIPEPFSAMGLCALLSAAAIGRPRRRHGVQ